MNLFPTCSFCFLLAALTFTTAPSVAKAETTSGNSNGCPIIIPIDLHMSEPVPGMGATAKEAQGAAMQACDKYIDATISTVMADLALTCPRECPNVSRNISTKSVCMPTTADVGCGSTPAEKRTMVNYCNRVAVPYGITLDACLSFICSTNSHFSRAIAELSVVGKIVCY